MILQFVSHQRLLAPALAGFLAAAAPAAALTLEEAVDRALAGSPQVEAADAQAHAAQAQAGSASWSRLPRITADWSGQRSDHPVFVFGSLLAQERFTAQDFGSIDFNTGTLDLSNLNTPDPVTNFRAALMIEQPIWTGGAVTSRLDGARALSDAAHARARRTREQIAYDTERAYRAAVLVEAKLATLRESGEVAREEARRVERLHTEGLALEADRRALEAHVLETEAALAAALADSVEARSSLGLLLGLPSPVEEPLAQPPMVDGFVTEPAVLDSSAMERADVQAARSGARAAETQVKGARSPFFPAVSAHAGIEHNSQEIFGAGGDQWLVGVGARWTFDLGVPSQTNAASAQAEAARTQAHLVQEGARHEVRVAEGRLTAARLRSDALSRALEAAGESFRLMRARHAEGLAGAFDLIAAQNTLTRTRLEARAAEHDVMLAASALRLASGTMELPEVAP